MSRYLSTPVWIFLIIAAVVAGGGLLCLAVWPGDQVTGPDLTAARKALQDGRPQAVVEIVKRQSSQDAKDYVRAMGRELRVDAVPALIPLLDSRIEPRAEVRAKAATALNYGVPADEPKDPTTGPVKALAAAVREDPDPAVRASAARTLGYSRTWEAMHQLIDAMEDEDVAVRAAALEAVNKILCMRLDFRPGAPKAQRTAYVKKLRACWNNEDFRPWITSYYKTDYFKSVYKTYAR